MGLYSDGLWEDVEAAYFSLMAIYTKPFDQSESLGADHKYLQDAIQAFTISLRRWKNSLKD